ncbi:MAG: ArsR/SmtB family transcription factor [Devosia sp.]
MSSDDQDERLFKALANGLRRRILDALKLTPLTTGMLIERFPGVDRCTVMQHLKVLEEAGLVIVERRGRERWNHLNALPFRDIHARWIGPYAALASEGLAGLRDRLEA